MLVFGFQSSGQPGAPQMFVWFPIVIFPLE
jgi:hypothetical protein